MFPLLQIKQQLDLTANPSLHTEKKETHQGLLSESKLLHVKLGL